MVVTPGSRPRARLGRRRCRTAETPLGARPLEAAKFGARGYCGPTTETLPASRRTVRRVRVVRTPHGPARVEPARSHAARLRIRPRAGVVQSRLSSRQRWAQATRSTPSSLKRRARRVSSPARSEPTASWSSATEVAPAAARRQNAAPRSSAIAKSPTKTPRRIRSASSRISSGLAGAGAPATTGSIVVATSTPRSKSWVT